MRPAFIVFALTAFAVARPFETTSTDLTARDVQISDASDAFLNELVQEWLAEQGSFDLETVDDSFFNALKNVGKKVLDAAKPHLKDALSKGVSAIHDHIQGHLAGAAAGAADAAADATADATAA